MEKENVSLLNSMAALAKKSLLSRIFGKVISDGCSMALWRMPQQNTSHLFVDLQSNRKFEIDSLEDLQSAFVFAPFRNSSGLLIQGELQINFQNDGAKINPPTVKGEALTWLEKAVKTDSDVTLRKIQQTHSTSSKDYKQRVISAVDKINEGLFKKVVPARIHIKPWKGDPVKAYIDLSERYPNAFVSLTYTPTSGCWIGATPELLLRVDKNKIFTTSSLAGTKLFHQDIDLHNVTWTQKEIEEQAMVSRYIINCFKTIRLREFEEEGPKTVSAGNLVHLRTDFIVDMQATNFLNLGSTMLRLLHPTSAICGMPKKAAMDFIQESENFDREYFSGYLGPVNVENMTQLFVNIRCARLFDSRATVYAGAGVTSYSKANSEWEETELKCNTLLDVIS